MSAYFCGNPFNHPEHETEDGYCEGVHRQEVKEEIVEKFEPNLSEGTEMAEDGTEYHKVTILIEHKNGDLITIHAPKASYPSASATAIPHIPLDKTTVEYYPEIERVDFVFKPHTTDEAPAITITKVKADG